MENRKRTRRWSFFKWFLGISGVGILVLALAAVWLLFSPGRPDAKKIQAVQQQRKKLRAERPAWAMQDETPGRPKPAALPNRDGISTASVSAGAPPKETDQQRCDRLFRELLACNQGQPGFREPIGLKNDFARYTLDARTMDKAHELASFYTQAIKVSPEARKAYQPRHGRILGLLADMMAKGLVQPGTQLPYYKGIRYTRPEDDRPRTDKQLKQIIESLRFLRVAGCTAWGLEDWRTSANWRLGQLLEQKTLGDRTTLPSLPEPIATMELELLAPRKLAGWEKYLGQVMELRQATLDYDEPQTSALNRFRTRIEIIDRDFARAQTKPKPIEWLLYKGLGMTVMSIVTIVDQSNTVRGFNQKVEEEKAFLTYLAQTGQPGPIQSVSDDTFQCLRITNEQLEARVLAGTLELRRGRAIPKPGEIKSGDYLFDPITRQPMRFYRQTATTGLTRLFLVWPNRPATEDSDIQFSYLGPYRKIGVLLEANHPGLENVPELKMPQWLINEAQKKTR